MIVNKSPEKHVHSVSIKKVKENMFDDDLIYDLAELFKVFGDSTRAKILSCLEIGELCVYDICECLNMNKSAISCKRSYYVGEAVTEEDIKAKYQNGTLILNYPKKDKKEPPKKMINID